MNFKIRKINKRGEKSFQEEVAEIIIAILCISFLIYFAFLIYQGSREKTEGRQAKSTLEEMVLRVEKMDSGQEATYLYLAPKNYYFKISDELNGKISSCLTKYCLCLCNKEDCSDYNVCRKTDKLFWIWELNGKEISIPSTYILKNEDSRYVLTLVPKKVS